MTVTGSAAPSQGRIVLKGGGGSASDSTVHGDGYRLRPDGDAGGYLLDPICFRQLRGHFARMRQAGDRQSKILYLCFQEQAGGLYPLHWSQWPQLQNCLPLPTLHSTPS